MKPQQIANSHANRLGSVRIEAGAKLIQKPKVSLGDVKRDQSHPLAQKWPPFSSRYNDLMNV